MMTIRGKSKKGQYRASSCCCHGFRVRVRVRVIDKAYLGDSIRQ